MAVKEFAQEVSKDKDGRRHVSIGQTRDEIDEWITPVTLWERNKNNGLYLPPGLIPDEDVAMPRMKLDTDAQTTLEAVQAELELVKSELQTIKGNQLSGDQKVQLSGTVVETVILHNEIAIADTNAYGVNLDVSKYRAFNIWMGTTLDTPVKIAYNVFFPPGKGQNVTHREWKNDSWVHSTFNLELPPGLGYYNLTSLIQPAHRFTRMIRLIVRCDIAPTKGSILSWVEGELR